MKRDRSIVAIPIEGAIYTWIGAMTDGGTRFWYPVMYDTGTLGHKSSCVCMDIARVLNPAYLKFELFYVKCEATFGSVFSLLSSWLCLPTELGFGS